ncbi:YcxB family protein [Devosia ginsengisoli]|uniref:YcxB family protein n=1 Tax=Devosia ginsengisoli TaxID=400770 RepID=A0A5B8LWC9_9HYPH|nr:YcxB family protein [Devosia ginsengisoli]QDZ11772.1 YcxB family protein [Devosia ginsengisoli]
MERTESFALVADDVVAANGLYTLTSLRQRKVLIAWTCLWLGFVAFLTFIDGVDRALASWPMLLGISLLPFLAILLVVWIMGPISARRMFRQQKSLQGRLVYGWSDAGLHTESEYGSFDIPWSHFIRWAEDDRTFLLFESDRLYRMVPKRVLTTDQQASLRRALVGVGG